MNLVYKIDFQLINLEEVSDQLLSVRMPPEVRVYDKYRLKPNLQHCLVDAKVSPLPRRMEGN